jgi:hypothetical protein
MEARPKLFGHIPGHVLHTLQDGMSIENVFPDILGTPIHGLYNPESWVFISGQCFAYIGVDIPKTPIHGPSTPESRVFITGQCLHPLEVIRAHPELLQQTPINMRCKGAFGCVSVNSQHSDFLDCGKRNHLDMLSRYAMQRQLNQFKCIIESLSSTYLVNIFNK